MIKRYRKGAGSGSMVESSTGAYVMFADYAALKTALTDIEALAHLNGPDDACYADRAREALLTPASGEVTK